MKFNGYNWTREELVERVRDRHGWLKDEVESMGVETPTLLNKLVMAHGDRELLLEIVDDMAVSGD